MFQFVLVVLSWICFVYYLWCLCADWVRWLYGVVSFQELFNDEFYAEAEDEKPQFSDIGEDEFGEETNWEEYENYGENLPKDKRKLRR